MDSRGIEKLSINIVVQSDLRDPGSVGPDLGNNNIFMVLPEYIMLLLLPIPLNPYHKNRVVKLLTMQIVYSIVTHDSCT